MTDPVLKGDAIQVERRYDHPIERVWRAVTTPEGLAEWFPAAVRFEGDIADFGDEQGTVLAFEPPHRVAFTWGDDQLQFELRSEGDGTVFVLTHTFSDRPGAASFASGWEHCLQVLSLVLAGKPAPEPDRFEARHEELVRAFGLDEPVVTRGDNGWSVRIERQLVVPAAVAWERLAAGPLGVPNVLVKLGDGTGHGARLVVAVNGSEAQALEPATAWVRAAVARAAAG